MIITKEAQERIIDKWNSQADRSTRDLLCFVEGMESVFALIEKNRKDLIDFYEVI